MLKKPRCFVSYRQSIPVLFMLSLLSACTTPSAIDVEIDRNNTPTSWSVKQEVNTENQTSQQNAFWLQQVITPELQAAIDLALNQNPSLKQSRLLLLQTEQRIIANGASFWPSLNLDFDTSARHNSMSDTRSNSSDLSLSARYELDIWGKLSAFEQQLNLEYSSQLASYKHQTHTLVKHVILAWYQVVESSQQLKLSQQRFANVKQNLAVIESGYESGLNSALDVYLSRNEVASEQAKLANQQTITKENLRELELLVGQYPSAAFNVNSLDIPNPDTNIALNLPSDVVKNNPQIQSQWMSLMAQDAAIAYAHKQRFPSLTFTASTGYASAELSDLLSNSLGWSILGSISTPIFNAGRLQANEEQARLKLKQTEQTYIERLFSVFSNIENGITKTKNLAISLKANQIAADSASLAEQISFEQYLKGLVSYTTVLDAQSRAFNAQSTLLSLRYQVLTNQLALYTDLGGDFTAVIDTTPALNNSVEGQKP